MAENREWQKQTLRGRLGELDSLTTRQCMTKQACLKQDGMFIKLFMARASTLHERINYNKLGKIEHVNNLPGTFYSKSRASLRHARHSIIANGGMDG